MGKEEVKRQKININQNVEIAPFPPIAACQHNGTDRAQSSLAVMLEKLCNIIDQQRKSEGSITHA